LLAGEAEGEPLLLLAPPVATRRRAHVGREVVGDPLLDFSQGLDRGDAGLLGQFATCGGLVILAVVDAALGELPVVRPRRAGAAAVPDAAVWMEQHDADVGAVLAEG